MEFDLFKPKAPPLFGLDISSSSVKMLEIVTPANPPTASSATPSSRCRATPSSTAISTISKP